MKYSLKIMTSLLFFAFLNSCGTPVPDTKGMTVEQAKKTLETATFTLGSVVYNQKVDGAQGAVVEQVPIASKRVGKGTIVNLTVQGFPPVEVPDLSKLDSAGIKVALETVGLKLGVSNVEYSDSISLGKIVSQKPNAKTMLSKGATVDVVLSKGKKTYKVHTPTQSEQTVLRRFFLSDMVDANINPASDFLIGNVDFNEDKIVDLLVVAQSSYYNGMGNNGSTTWLILMGDTPKLVECNQATYLGDTKEFTVGSIKNGLRSAVAVKNGKPVYNDYNSLAEYRFE